MTENKAIQIIKREEQWESNASISNAFNTAIKALEENQQYHAICTVEECQSAVEKQRTKRPIIINRSGRLTDFKCPCCGARRIVGIKARDEHCGDCGQKLDWE